MTPSDICCVLLCEWFVSAFSWGENKQNLSLFTILTERWRHRRFRFQNEAWCHAGTDCHVKSMGKRENHVVFVVILQKVALHINLRLCAPAIRKHFNFNEMDLFLSFLRAILPVIRDCPWKIVSTAPVSRLHISRWYTMLDAYTDSAMGICDKTLDNTKFSFSCTHKKRQCFVKLAAMSHQKTVNDGPTDSR